MQFSAHRAENSELNTQNSKGQLTDLMSSVFSVSPEMMNTMKMLISWMIWMSLPTCTAHTMTHHDT